MLSRLGDAVTRHLEDEMMFEAIPAGTHPFGQMSGKDAAGSLQQAVAEVQSPEAVNPVLEREESRQVAGAEIADREEGTGRAPS